MENNLNPQSIPVEFDPFRTADIIAVPTTAAQQEILANILIGGDDANRAYNESVSLHIAGPFDYNTLVSAVNKITERHDALRATFSEDGTGMLISASNTIPCELVDLSGNDSIQSDKIISNILENEADHVFNIHQGPLGQVKLINLSQNKHQLILTFHHIICDGWSLGILMKDLGIFYSAIIRGNTPQLDPAISFADFASDEQNYQSGSENLDAETYWINQYKKSIPQFELPLNFSRPAFRTFVAQRLDVPVDSNIIAALKKTGAKSGISFITTITCAFEIYLSRITGSDEIVVGLASAGQASTGLHNLVGHCVNLLPLKSNINNRLSFSEYLVSRKTDVLDAYDHQRYTFGSLIRKLNMPRDASRIPLVPVSFNVDLGITDGVKFENCSYTFTTNARKYENFEIFINAAGNGNDLVLECTFNTSLFSVEMMQLRMNEFLELLKSFVQNPDLPVSHLNILTSEEKQNIYVDWQGSLQNYPLNKCIHQLIENTALTSPDAIALKQEGISITYRELEHRSNKYAHYLISKGVKQDVPVIIYMERSADMVLLILAVLKSGGAYVPVDLAYPHDRLEYVIKDSGNPLILAQHKFKNYLQTFNNVIFIEDIVIDSQNSESSIPNINHSSSQLAYIIYTSGSTGKPKGVAIEHSTVVNYISWCNDYYFNNREFGNFGFYSSLSFDLTVTSIFCALTRGKTLTIFNQEAEVPDILKQSFAKDSGIDTIKLTPAHVMVLENFEQNATSIRKAIVGGEELLPRHVEILRALNPEMEIVNEYGPTEATVGCIIKDVVLPEDAFTIGRPISNTHIFILDKNLQSVPPGVPGKLFISGAGLARYYYNRPELTDEKFQILTVNDESFRMYDSGDLARYRINGDIDFLGRIDDQVKIRGYRIELGEIESEISNINGVSEQVVIVKKDNNGEKRLVAYVVFSNNAESDVSIIKNQLAATLPAYMVPASIIILDQLPLTVNGKVDKKLLPDPGQNPIAVSADFKEPQTPIEQVLANIWCTVLSLEKIGRFDNFFEFGGHSILGVKMLNEVEKQLGVKINLSMLFTASTIEELARLINKDKPAKPISCIVALQPNGKKRPLFCIHMHNGNVNRWRVMIKHLGTDRPLYAIQPLGLDVNQNPHTTIEEMASYYISLVKQIQPHGPYQFIGLCFSGMVVFEIAAQLQQSGEKVSFLGMINNYAPPENPTAYRILTGIDKFRKMETGDMIDYAVGKTTRIGKSIFDKVKILSPVKQSVEVLHDKNSENEIGHDLRTIHSVALLHYHPSHIYKGDLIIIRNALPIEYPYNEFLGWDRLIKGSIETTIIEGSDNDTIITDEPYNVILSLKVKEYLEKTENQDF